MAWPNEIPPEELLEEMLKIGNHEFYPKFRGHFLRFIDTFNHETVQKEITSLLDEVNIKLNAIDSSTTVFDILVNLRIFLNFVKDKSNPTKFLGKLQESGYFALLNDDRFNFLDESISLDESADRLLDLVKSEAKTNVNQSFEDYVASWTMNQRSLGRPDNYIRSEVVNMRRGRQQADEVSNREAQTIIDDIRRFFEPLREDLMPLQTVNAYTFGLFSLTGALVGDAIGDNSYTKNSNRSRPDWFDGVVKFCVVFLNGGHSESSLKNFLEREKLEDDFSKFKRCMDNWLLEIKAKTRRPSSLRISKDVAEAELDRMAKFVYAVALNKPELLVEHNALVDTLVRKAADDANTSFLPFVSFGQLPVPGKGGTRLVRLTFVLPSGKSRAFAQQTLQKLRSVFSKIEKEIVEDQGASFTLIIDIKVDDNLPVLIARNAAKLSDLSVRAVLVGSFGLGGFRHAMNPEFSRIYGTEEAEGFITTSFPGSILRGGEPYYCPNGWRRYAINVGMTGDQFERAYGDWPLAYHGTAGHISASILQSGIRASGQGCYLDSNIDGCVYLSPSIEYCSHPRYAQVWKVRNKYVQMVLQVRVKKCLVYFQKPGTLPGAYPTEPAMDPNFGDNHTLEWLVKWPPYTHVDAVGGVVVYGLMLRVTNEHPGRLEQCRWWEQSRGPDYWNYF